MDKIEELLKYPKTDLQKQALTDTSYKNIDHSLSDDDTNAELATYGDAILKLALCKIYRDRKNAGIEFSDNLSKWKEKHESDEVLVRVIAKHFKLLEFLKYDKREMVSPKSKSRRTMIIKEKTIKTGTNTLLPQWRQALPQFILKMAKMKSLIL